MRLRPLLWHLPVSHYSEKVRWALDHKRIPHDRRALIGGLHIPIALTLTHGQSYTLPVIELDGRTIGDSTAIIAAVEQTYPEHPLYPADPAERRHALELEDWFDQRLGPDIRRFVFHALRSDPKRFDDLAASQIPAALRRYRRLGRRAAPDGAAPGPGSDKNVAGGSPRLSLGSGDVRPPPRARGRSGGSRGLG